MNSYQRLMLPLLAAAAAALVAEGQPHSSSLPAPAAPWPRDPADNLTSRVTSARHDEPSGFVLAVTPRPTPRPALRPTLGLMIGPTTPGPGPANGMQADASSSSAYVHRSVSPRSGPWPGAAPGPASSGSPSSYSYFMQVQPHPRSSAYRERTRQSVRLVNLGQGDTAAAVQGPGFDLIRDHFHERPPFTGPTFQSFPFGPINVPATFTHGNPLASHHQRPPLPTATAENTDGDDAPALSFSSTGSQLSERPVHGSNRGRPRLRRPTARPADIVVLGDPRRPNLGIVGVPGQGRYPPPSTPQVREYDPYTGRFRVVATADGYDSREAYSHPAQAETGGLHEDSQPADVEAVRQDESYEVYETPEEKPSVVAVASTRGGATSCRQRDLLSDLLSPLLRVASNCQKSERFASLHRPRAPPPRRKQVKQRVKQKHHRKQQHQQLRQREPYFEFRNPVHDYISGSPHNPEPRGRMVGEDANEAADAEYLAMGDAEREARDDTEEQRLLAGRGDQDVFAPYSVYRTVLEPDKKFRPFVRFPFEAERSDLKAMVNDLMHEG